MERSSTSSPSCVRIRVRRSRSARRDQSARRRIEVAARRRSHDRHFAAHRPARCGRNERNVARYCATAASSVFLNGAGSETSARATRRGRCIELRNERARAVAFARRLGSAAACRNGDEREQARGRPSPRDVSAHRHECHRIDAATLSVSGGGEPPSSSGLGRRPFTAVTGIRIPLGVRFEHLVLWCSLECTPPCQGGGRGFKSRQDRVLGTHESVKCDSHAAVSERQRANWREQRATARRVSRRAASATQDHGRVAQLAEHAPEKREVTGSTPVPATRKSLEHDTRRPLMRGAAFVLGFEQSYMRSLSSTCSRNWRISLARKRR